MEAAIRRVLEADPRVTFGLIFGSTARGENRPDSDIDVAIGLLPGSKLDVLELGGLIGELEGATRRVIDLVVLNNAASPLAYRVFRDGKVVFVRNRDAMVTAKTRAILEYLDFQPVEKQLAEGVFRTVLHG